MRTQTVFGEGPLDATIMFVGEQPGDQEDLAGRPFVGPAGQVFDEALEKAGIAALGRLRHQCGQAFQVRAARQEAHPQQARRRRDRGLPLVDRAGARADPPAGHRRARRDRGALAARQGRDHQPRARIAAAAGRRRRMLGDGPPELPAAHPRARPPRRGARASSSTTSSASATAPRSWPPRSRSGAAP